MASILIFFKQGKVFREIRIYGNNFKIVNNRQPLKKKFAIYKIFFFVVRNVQPLLQVPKNFIFRSPVTTSRYGVTSLNETSLPSKSLWINAGDVLNTLVDCIDMVDYTEASPSGRDHRNIFHNSHYATRYENQPAERIFSTNFHRTLMHKGN
jgi:hypothetical protein